MNTIVTIFNRQRKSPKHQDSDTYASPCHFSPNFPPLNELPSPS